MAEAESKHAKEEIVLNFAFASDGTQPQEQRGTVYLTEPVRQRNTEQEGRYQTVNHREQ